MNLSKKRVLITGGGGFIGSHLCNELLRKNADVTLLDIFSVRGTSNIDKLDRVSLIDCDVRDEKKLGAITEKFDVIFHLAAIAAINECERLPAKAFEVNVKGTYNILNFAKRSNCERVVFPSSAQLYGREPKYLPIDETHPLEIESSVYNVTKRLGENLCYDFSNLHSLDTRVVRLFNTFGPKQGIEYLIPTMITQALTNGKIELWNGIPSRDFNYVSNTVDALIRVAEYDEKLSILNVGYGKEISISQLVSYIAAHLDVKVHFLNKPVLGSLRLHCDNSKIRHLLHWEPKISFEEGLTKTIEFYKNVGKPVIKLK